MNEQPTRNIIVVVALDRKKIPVEFSQKEYVRVEEVANAQCCSVAEFARDAALEYAKRADIAKSHRKIIKFPDLT